MVYNDSINLRELEIFFKNYKKQKLIKILLLMFISFGFYLINWIYFINIQLEKIDKNAPDSKRGVIILLIMPIFWSILMIIIKKLIFSENEFTVFLNFFGWLIITFLSLKYIYDFCISFGKITQSNGLIWYLLIYIGYYSVILGFFGIWQTLFLILIPIITIPQMQNYLNEKSEKFILKKQSQTFNYMTRAKI